MKKSILLSVALCGLLVAAGTAQAAQTPLLSPAPNNQVAIAKSAMGKEFLMSAAVIPQLVAATGTSLASKIVRFELFADGVDLYESTEGLVVTNDLPARRLLTTFPIVPQNDPQKVVIDFNAGMRRVFNDMWYSKGGDGASSSKSPLNQARSLEIPQGRVFEVRSEGEQLVVRQSAQVRDRENDPNKEDRFEIRYFIAPYQPGDFPTKEHSASVTRYVRFFESSPQIASQSGRTSSRIALFDIRKPIVIHYSANTPPEYEEAVRDGILYWNRAFGREVVKAEKAQEGVTAPDPRYNMVQWVPWDTATRAYADVMIDPRSGNSQRGQAFMTSTFAFSGRGKARALLRMLKNGEAGSKAPSMEAGELSLTGTASHKASGVSGLFANARACDFDLVEHGQQFAAGLEAALADVNFTDEAAKRVSGDYVREVVAHEVGHMMGLRHNFAGSLGGTLSDKELSEWFKAYIADDKTKVMADRMPSITVMDYLDLRAAAFIGWKIRTCKDVLPYDAAAIGWGYFAKTDVVDKRMYFGTDEDSSVYGDVVTFDRGAEPVVAAYASIGEEIRNLPNMLIETFIAAKTPRDVHDRREVAEVSLDPEKPAKKVGDAYGRLLSWFKAGQRSLRVEQAFPFVGPLNEKEVLLAHWKSLNEQVEKLGGVDRAAFSFLPVDLKLDLKGEPSGVETAEKIDSKKLSERLAKLLESAEYTRFTGLDEKPATFSKEEKAIILERGRKYFEEFEKEVLKQVCKRLEKAPRDLGARALEEISEDDVVARLEKRIVELAREVVMARDENTRRRGKVDKSMVEVVEFRHDLETRVSAARMIAEGSAGSYRNWAAEPRSELIKTLKESVETALNIQNFKEFKEPMLSRTLRDWYLNQQSVLAVLGHKPSPPSPPAAPAAPTAPKTAAE